jgi:hypothetical protein
MVAIIYMQSLSRAQMGINGGIDDMRAMTKTFIKHVHRKNLGAAVDSITMLSAKAQSMVEDIMEIYDDPECLKGVLPPIFTTVRKRTMKDLLANELGAALSSPSRELLHRLRKIVAQECVASSDDLVDGDDDGYLHRELQELGISPGLPMEYLKDVDDVDDIIAGSTYELASRQLHTTLLRQATDKRLLLVYLALRLLIAFRVDLGYSWDDDMYSIADHLCAVSHELLISDLPLHASVHHLPVQVLFRRVRSMLDHAALLQLQPMIGHPTKDWHDDDDDKSVVDELFQADDDDCESLSHSYSCTTSDSQSYSCTNSDSHSDMYSSSTTLTTMTMASEDDDDAEDSETTSALHEMVRVLLNGVDLDEKTDPAEAAAVPTPRAVPKQVKFAFEHQDDGACGDGKRRTRWMRRGGRRSRNRGGMRTAAAPAVVPAN